MFMSVLVPVIYAATYVQKMPQDSKLACLLAWDRFGLFFSMPPDVRRKKLQQIQTV